MSTLTSPLIWVNGAPSDQISVLDRGLAYGDGLFETCRLHQGRIPFWSRHLCRLQASATAFAIDLNIRQLQAWLDAALARVNEQSIAQGTLKIIVTRGRGGRGYQRPEDATPTVVMTLYPDNLEPLSRAQSPARVRVCDMSLGRNRLLAGHKHLNRLECVLARAEWQGTDFDEGLMLDDQANVIEATAHNLFVYRDDCWLTPALHEAGVAGVMRQLVIEELAPRCGVEVLVQAISLAELYEADELMLCNSNRGLRSVASLEDTSGAIHQFSVHDNTQRLNHALNDFLQGKR